MPIMNCWEYKRCGKDRKNRLGVCPAFKESMADGLNRGRNGGRICWAVDGTCCHNSKQGTYAQKVLLCSTCDFRMMVQKEEGDKFQVVYFKAKTTDEQVLTMLDDIRFVL